MDTALTQKIPFIEFILDRNLAKANCSGNQVCTPCDIVVLGPNYNIVHSRKDFGFFIKGDAC